MKCSKCKVELKSSDLGEYGLVIIDVCPSCEGVWFDKGELDRLDDSVWTDVESVDFKKGSSQHKNATCPKCSNNLEALTPKDAGEVVVDRCVSCGGFWLDKGELDKMRDVADDVDTQKRENAVTLQRPPDWSFLKWITYRYKQFYNLKK
jgi:uncharacterized protein